MAADRTSTSPAAATALTEGWELALSAPGAFARPGESGGAEWLPAIVPGTAAQALAAAGRWRLDRPEPLHDKDVWYRTRIAGQGRHLLRFHGLATIAEVWLDDELLLTSRSMFEAQEVAVELSGEHRLCLAFRSLEAALVTLAGPRARWKPRMIPDQRLRLVRTTLLGHMPGWCPPVHAVGPWRPVELIDAGTPRIVQRRLHAGLDGEDGLLEVSLVLSGWDGEAPAEIACGGQAATLQPEGGGRFTGTLRIPAVERWWPHTVGEPRLHAAELRVGGARFDLGRVGFRTLALDRDADGQGFALVVNGVRVFCGGACWTPPDIVGLPGTRAAYADALATVRAANVTMLRIGGTMTYEAPAFFELCDELGILVWQEAMLANFDYPADEAFLAAVRREIAGLLDGIGASPSLAVLCGGSEVFQQAAMLGLPAGRWSSPLFDALLPEVLAERRPDAIYVPSSPSGGVLPFVASGGPTHYYGVGAYCRPLEDARRADVRFASECLAFANVPEDASLRSLPVPAVHHPGWKERTPRDAGASWDFEDVRDHYLAELWGVDARRLRLEDPERYLELSRAVTAEVTERTIDEWRRPASRTAGALVWFWKDLWLGAGWGAIDALGRPKSVWHALGRALAPLRLTISDEGVNGLVAHVVNAGPRPVAGRLVLECLREGAIPVVAGRRAVEVGPHGGLSLGAFELIGAFFDAGHAYRFGPCAHDVVTARLESVAGEVLAEAFHLMPQARIGRHRADIVLAVERDDQGWLLRLSAARTLLFVTVTDETFATAENGFHLAPKREKSIRLRALPGFDPNRLPKGEVRAVNIIGATRYEQAASAAPAREDHPRQP
ncbi:glycosyl hydrolase 2 galactose-binding domain-containing protein [Labrys wisconsinensis]|uniref:Beta-mannosidase n=1 Tax=Labrys wisconsinensis TaxID=425677 RepID=A0ABU0J0W8_9HYPH|nr:glycoside hydrolase family 2 protein [Labrys wisconsinensis]MDQ0467265.1 beta-mannosidase [Labrys wisconsinensis]